jgi:hypothetical protein
MANEKKEIIRKGYQPENKEKLNNENRPKGRNITAADQHKGDQKGKSK